MVLPKVQGTVERSIDLVKATHYAKDFAGTTMCLLLDGAEKAQTVTMPALSKIVENLDWLSQYTKRYIKALPEKTNELYQHIPNNALVALLAISVITPIAVLSSKVNWTSVFNQLRERTTNILSSKFTSEEI